MEFIFHHKNTMLLLIIMLFLVLGNCQVEFTWSRATYYGSPDCQGNPTGACGYGDYGRTVNDGYVAGVHRPYRNGTGCGGCYQVRCKAGECTDEGVVVVATDFGVGDWTDFLFPARAYTKMARPGSEARLLAYGIVNIEYRRVPCTFRGSNTLIYSVHEGTRYPHYLAIIIIYPPGLYDVVGAQIWQEDCKAWRPMRKPYGAIWDMENPPRGDLRIRFLISATGSINDAILVESPTLIPAYWKAGLTYQLAISS